VGKARKCITQAPWKDGIELSILALGGIVVCGMPQQEASKRVAVAYERGVNYFDCAPSYFNGEAEMKLGKALQPYRSKVFLAEKTGSGTRKGRGRNWNKRWRDFIQIMWTCTSFMR
jgi:aryl-alcohol dehydrogenase-like predicted oxidoreductase